MSTNKNTKKKAISRLPQKRKVSPKQTSNKSSDEAIIKTKHRACGFLVAAIICGIIVNILTFSQLLSTWNYSDFGVGASFIMAGIMISAFVPTVLGFIFLMIAWGAHAKLSALTTHHKAILLGNIFASIVLIIPIVFFFCYDNIHRAYIDKANSVDSSSPREGIAGYLKQKYNIDTENTKVRGSCPSGDILGQCTYDVTSPSVYATFHVTASRPTIQDKWTYDDDNTYGLARYNKEIEDYYMQTFADHGITVVGHRVMSVACNNLDINQGLDEIKNNSTAQFVVSIEIPATLDVNLEKDNIYRDAKYIEFYRSVSEPSRRVFEQYKSNNVTLEVNIRLNDKTTIPQSRYGNNEGAIALQLVSCGAKKQIRID